MKILRGMVGPFVVWSGAVGAAAEPVTLRGHQTEVYSLAFSPDGKTLASGEAALSEKLVPGEIMLWDVATGRKRATLAGHAGGIWSMAYAPDGKTLASAGAEGTVILRDAADGRARATLKGHDNWVRSLAFTPDGETLASGGNDKTIRLWDVATGRERAVLRGHAQGVTCLAIRPDGKTLASVSFDDNLRVWDLATGRERASLSGKNASYAMTFSPDGTTLALGGFVGVQLWDAETWKVRETLDPRASNVYATAYTADGKILAATAGKGVRTWDAATGRERGSFDHGNVVLSLAISPDGKTLASGNGATAPFEVKLWDLALAAPAASPTATAVPCAFIDGTGTGWRSLGEADFQRANCDPETWTWKDGVTHCTGQPVGVLRSKAKVSNFELVARWRHLKTAGNSGFFVWVPDRVLEGLKRDALPGGGIEIQVLDHGYTEEFEKSSGKKADWFTTHGDVFPVGSSRMTPFAPTSPDGSRSFPAKRLSKGVGEWNHYYIRAINGEVRLWVNGEEVSGGSNCDPRAGYLCLESEGSPVEFRDLRIRELP